MSLQPLQGLFLSSLSLSLLLSTSVVAFAEGDGVVVPTIPSGSSTTVPSGSTTLPSGSSTNTPNSNTANSNKRFDCVYYNGQYTVMYQPQSRPGQFFAWAAPQTMGGGWAADKRCAAIADRLELYRPDGLQELQIAVENNENIICVTTEANPSCRIVLTVPRDKDPYAIRSSVFNNLASADNGQQTTAVNTYTDRNRGSADELYNLGRTLLGGTNRVNSSKNGINLKPFLDPQDGGTASQLRNGVSISRKAKPTHNRTILNPRLFR